MLFELGGRCVCACVCKSHQDSSEEETGAMRARVVRWKGPDVHSRLKQKKKEKKKERIEGDPHT